MRIHATLLGATSFGWMLLATPAESGVQFYVGDEAGFGAATASQVLAGTEDWSSATSTVAVTVADSLQPGVPKSPFPNGVTAATGMTVQSNTLGSAGTTPSPGSNLFYAPAGFVGASGAAQPSNQLSALLNGSGFDMIFAPVAGESPSAVSLSPMFYRTTGAANFGPISVKVFGASGAQIGTTTVPIVVDVSESAFLGVVATPPDVVGRIHLWAGANAVPGADNIEVYRAPEPLAAASGAAALAALGLASLRLPRRAPRSAPSDSARDRCARAHVAR